KSKYRVGGYPTIVFAAPDGDEISRIVGFRERGIFLEAVAQARKDKDQGFTRLKKLADQGNASAAAKVGQIYLERRDFASAKKYLAKSPNVREALFEAEISELELKSKSSTEAGSAALTQKLQSAIQAFPNTVDSIDR